MGRAGFLRKTMGGTGLRFTAHGLVFCGPTRPIETSVLYLCPDMSDNSCFILDVLHR